ncbi:LanA [Trypoxylus dichotomus]
MILNELTLLFSLYSKERVKQKFEKILDFTRDAKNIVEKAKIDLNNGTRYYDMAKEAYDNLARQANALYNPIHYMNRSVISVEKEIPKIEDDRLPEAHRHADNLTEKAQNLDNIFKETQGISENALKAVNAYLDIENAIEEAYVAAQQSKEFIDNATSFYDNLNTEIADAIASSNNASQAATNTSQYVELQLKPQLSEAVVKSRKIRSLHEKNKEDLEHIEDFIKKYPVMSYEDLLLEAIKTTEKANQTTDKTVQALGNNYNEVPTQTAEAKQLPKKVDETNRHVLQVEKQLEIIKDKLPKILNDLSSFPMTGRPGRSEDLDERIKKLKQQISLARDIANRIKVGVRFYKNTTLELRNPDNLEQLSTSTKISGYFRTNNTFGLLIYLGNANGTGLRRTKTDDYMALEIENGYPVLTLDIGNGQERILNNKFVADGNWYQFIIERTGLNAKLTIREEIAGGRIKETVGESGLQAPYIIFNLDKNLSKLFVGGYPSEFNMQSTVKQEAFDGEMEEIVVGDTPVSLWNFNSGFENHRGARERNKLVNLSPPTGCRFSGTGFVVIDARRYAHKIRNNIQLNFKTFASEGLLFLYGNATTYIALEIRDGKVLFKYNLGYGTKVFQTVNTYNDGEWHHIEAKRESAEGRLNVDAEEIRGDGAAIQGNALGYSDYFYFGGYVKMHNYSDVTNKGFDGCIDKVDAGNPINLNHNHKAYGIIPGCPVKFARLVSFVKTEPGYIKLDNIHVRNDITMALKFKTNTNNGLIFYLTDKNQASGISLSLVNGKLKLISQRHELVSKEGNFNDSQWHVVSITHNSQVLRLDFDDYEAITTDSAPPSLDILYGNLYIGGIPSNFIAKQGHIASSESFVGCIADATLNGSIINFANSTEKVGDILGTCVLDAKAAPDFDEVPELPPPPELGSFTTLGPQYPTDWGHLDIHPSRGDLGGPHAPSPVKPIISTPPTEPETTRFEEHETTAPTILPEFVTELTSTTTVTVPTTVPTPPPSVVTPRILPKPVTTPAPPPTPEPEPSCALPMHPTPHDEVAGPFYFGTKRFSRIEYDHARGKFRKQFKFSFDIKTNDTSGIIFFTSDKQLDNFIILYMENGYLIYKVRSSKDAGHSLQSADKFNDGEWHNVVLLHNQSMQLVVDDNLQTESKTKAIGKLEVDELFMLGGVREDSQYGLETDVNNVHSFKGCIKNFYMNNKPMEKPRKFDVQPCPENVEEGNFFNSGHLILKPRYTVGEEIDIKMDIKPRNVTGLLLTVHGKRDYLVLEMVHGGIKFTVENGKGPITTTFSPERTHYLCDGHWHTIQAFKSKNIVGLSVDNKIMPSVVGDYRSKSTDTGGALFLGSHRVINKVRGITARVPFLGCIRNIRINNEPIIIMQSMRRGEVTVGQCPTN